MDLPRTVQGLGGPISVRKDPEVSPSEDLMGLAQLRKREIRVEDHPACAEATHVSTFYHELMHFALWDSGHHVKFDDDTIEIICDLAGTMMARLGTRP